MALFRNIVKHKDKEFYAYVEFSDEDPNHVVILGGKEFATIEEAREHVKGFAQVKKEPVIKEAEGQVADTAKTQNRKRR
jgi:hypothetical protein